MTVSLGRQIAWEALVPFKQGMKSRVHAEDRLDALFLQHGADARERGFATYLTYGVLRHWFVLEYLISEASHFGLAKLDKRLVLLLRMGLFQLLWMDQVPAYAAVSQTLAQAEAMGVSKKGRGVLSAVLNRASRGELSRPEDETVHSMPTWWSERLVAQVGAEEAGRIAKAQLEIPVMSLRVNTLKTSPEAFVAALSAAEIPFEQDIQWPDRVVLKEGAGAISALPGFAEGHFVVQDASSMAVSLFLDPKPGETILEIGAAPGSKTAHMAALMQNQGRIIATDLSEKRLTQLADNVSRLGVSNVETRAVDGRTLQWEEPLVDRVLIDAPCSGTGTMGKHPEILLSLQASDLVRFAHTQGQILRAGFEALKPGGVLVYSTCSIDHSENDAVIEAFLTQTPSAKLLDKQTRWPDGHQDGFFMARVGKMTAS